MRPSPRTASGSAPGPATAGAIGADPQGWLLAQLDAPAARRPAGAPESARVLAEVRELRVARQVAAQVAREPRRVRREREPPPPSPGIDEQAIREFGEFVREHYVAQTAERHRLAIETDRPFVERLVHFWSNHFAVSADKQPLAALAGLYEQEAIRPHVTGNFYDLLLAAERHPAMILYLDNQASMGPSSPAATLRAPQPRPRARPERESRARNPRAAHARRRRRLHASRRHGIREGADGLVDRRHARRRRARRSRASAAIRGGPASSTSARGMHEPGDKTILGKRYRERGAEEGEDVLRTLALHPRARRAISRRSSRGTSSPTSRRRSSSSAWPTSTLRNDGELTRVYRALIEADESWREPLAKFKTPHDFVISAYRSLDFVPENLQPDHGVSDASRPTAVRARVAGRLARHGGELERRRRAAEAHRVRGGAAGAATPSLRGLPRGVDPLARAGEVLGEIGEHTTMSIRDAAEARVKDSRCCSRRPNS